MPWLFLAFSAVSALLTWNVDHPRYRPGPLAALSFFAGWLVGELALHQILFQGIMAVGFIVLGGLSRWPGYLALALLIWSVQRLGRDYLRARSTDALLEVALTDGLGEEYREGTPEELALELDEPLDWRSILAPFPVRHHEVERVRNIEFHVEGRLSLKLDVIRRRPRSENANGSAAPSTGKAPIFLFVHGGAWVFGSKDEQGLPVMLRLARLGWVCFTISYRLSPRATFPDHLVDVKRAIRWVREHAAEYGADPSLIVIGGGSAGGHLASLAALTPSDPAYQPGFERVDTSVAACISFYGVYDFADRHGSFSHRTTRALLERYIMKSKLADAAEAWDRASPIACIGKNAPPFFVIHGTHDSLVPVAQSRRFVDAFKDASAAPIVYAEIPGAQHAFELFPSLRSLAVARGVARFATWVEVRERAQRAAVATAEAAAVAHETALAGDLPSATG